MLARPRRPRPRGTGRRRRAVGPGRARAPSASTASASVPWRSTRLRARPRRPSPGRSRGSPRARPGRHGSAAPTIGSSAVRARPPPGASVAQRRRRPRPGPSPGRSCTCRRSPGRARWASTLTRCSRETLTVDAASDGAIKRPQPRVRADEVVPRQVDVQRPVHRAEELVDLLGARGEPVERPAVRRRPSCRSTQCRGHGTRNATRPGIRSVIPPRAGIRSRGMTRCAPRAGTTLNAAAAERPVGQRAPDAGRVDHARSPGRRTSRP